jgi:hypothetical protein
MLYISVKEDRTDYIRASVKGENFFVENVGYTDECFSFLSKGDYGKAYEQLYTPVRHLKRAEQIYLTLPTALFFIDCWTVAGSLLDVKPNIRVHFSDGGDGPGHYVDQSCNMNLVRPDNSGLTVTGAAIADSCYIKAIESLILNHNLNICSVEPELMGIVRLLALTQNFFTVVERFKKMLNISVFNVNNGLFTISFLDDNEESFEEMMYIAGKTEEETFEENSGRKKIEEMPLYFGELSKRDVQSISKTKYAKKVGKLVVPEQFKLTKRTRGVDLSRVSSLCGLALKSLIVEDFDTKINLDQRGLSSDEQTALKPVKNEFPFKKFFSTKLLFTKKKSNQAGF